MANRFSTMTEVRNVVWPAYETPEFEAANFLQGIAGTLELFHRSALSFQDLAGEVTGHPVAVFQRVDHPDPAKANDPAARSTKNFDNLAEANAFKAEKGKGVVVTKLGEPKACEYCPAFDICKQKDAYFAQGD